MDKRSESIVVLAQTHHIVAGRPALGLEMGAPHDGELGCRPMGQLVGVVEKNSSIPGFVRYELNRNLTGSGHEKFASADDAFGLRPAAELARRLFDTGRVAGVHVYMNMITVDLQKGFTSDGLIEVVRDLYQYWKPGMTPPAFEDLVPADEPAADAAAPTADGAAPLSAAASRVPAALLERSRAALAKWKASQSA